MIISKKILLATLRAQYWLGLRIMEQDLPSDFGYPVDYQGITAKSKSLIEQLDCFQGKKCFGHRLQLRILLLHHWDVREVGHGMRRGACVDSKM
jgi:hypothetical protein